MSRDKLPVALIPAVGVAAAAALAVGPAFGWADAAWLLWLGLFAVLEGNAIANETEGDTLSEKTRQWMRTKTPAGRFGFLALLGTACTWYAVHILG